MHPSHSVFDRHPVKSLSAIVLVLLVLLDLVAAAAYRIALGYPFHRREQFATPSVESQYRNQRTVYHHDLAKGVLFEDAAWGPLRYRMATNSLGFKDSEPREVALDSSGHRILFIGDSLTEGIGLTYDETFVGRIDAALEPRGVEVLNAAVASYSPIIYWRKLRYLIEDVGLEFDEVVAYIDISDIQDEGQRYEFDEEGAVVWPVHDRWRAGATDGGNPVKRAVRDGTILTYYLLNSIQALVSPPFATPLQKRLRSADEELSIKTSHSRGLWTLDEHYWKAFGERGLARAMQHMDDLHVLLAEHGKTLTVAIYPWPAQIHEADLDSRQVRAWTKWAAARGVVLLDYFPCFIQQDHSEQDRRAILTQSFIPDDVHWTALGHEVMASGFVAHYTDDPSTFQSACREALEPALGR